MTVSSEAKRTLVKSPPELWSEVSNAESLARHLDGVQQIRITRAQPETTVEWEADGASGSVCLQPSGFGTKVTLSLSRELPTPPVTAAVSAPLEPEPAPPEPEPATSEPAPTEPEHESHALPADPTSQAPAREERATELAERERERERVAAVEQEPPRGFFARLFKRQRKQTMQMDSAAIHEAEDDPIPAPEAKVEPEPAPEPEPQPVPVAAVEQALAAETQPEPVSEPDRTLQPEEPQTASVTVDLAALEAQMASEDEAMLAAMLDRLGAAHHRPFSRS